MAGIRRDEETVRHPSDFVRRERKGNPRCREKEAEEIFGEAAEFEFTKKWEKNRKEGGRGSVRSSRLRERRLLQCLVSFLSMKVKAYIQADTALVG